LLYGCGRSRLKEHSFWVCEKSDGVRVLLFILMNVMTGNQEVWLVSAVYIHQICPLTGLLHVSTASNRAVVRSRADHAQIDRKQRYFSIQNLHFTHWHKTSDPLTDTILDGELVIDIDQQTGVVSVSLSCRARRDNRPCSPSSTIRTVRADNFW
jgi:mRNA guanylyltransferase